MMVRASSPRRSPRRNDRACTLSSGRQNPSVGIAVACGGRLWRRLFCASGLPFLRRLSRTSYEPYSTSATSSPEGAVRRADHTASPWLDLAEGGLRLNRLRRDGAGSTYFPLAEAHSSRGKKLFPPPSSAALRPNGCVLDRRRLSFGPAAD